MRIIGITSMVGLALILSGCESQELSFESISSANLGSLKPQYEYQVRLDPANFVNRDEARTYLQQWLVNLSDDEVIRGLKFKDQMNEIHSLQRVEYFDTVNGDLGKRGWQLRRREDLGTGEGDLTLKADGKTSGEATTILFEHDLPDFKTEVKLENDIYAVPSRTKWAYSVTFEPRKTTSASLPASSEISTLAVLETWYPKAAKALGLPGTTRLKGRVEYQWRSRFSMKLGAEKVELDLLLPYSSRTAAISGKENPIDPELSWKPKRPGEENAQLQQIIKAAWGE